MFPGPRQNGRPLPEHLILEDILYGFLRVDHR